MKAYKTVAAEASDEFVEKRSRFIGQICPAATEEEAQAFIAAKKSRYWDATHNVWAYILQKDQIQRYSDDNEPQGTAGVPVLEVLRKSGLTDLAVVVTRYYGGIPLGAGGLVRAYSHGAKIAIDAAQVLHMNPCTVYEMELKYGLYSRLRYDVLAKYNVKTLESDFGEAVRLKVMLTTDKTEAFLKDIEEMSAATVHPKMVEELCADWQ